MISDLNKRITLQCPTRTSDNMGGWVEEYKDVATVWAKKTTHRSNEAVEAMRQTGKLTHNYRIRYRRDVRGNWRILDTGKYMAIIGPPIEVNEGPGRRWLDITAEEAS